MAIKVREIKLENGLELKIDEAALDDMELLELLADLDDGNGYAIPRVCRKLLGDEQKKLLYEQIRENGKVSITKAVDAMKEILDKLGDTGKN